MQIKDITVQNANNITPVTIVELARNDVIVMTLEQFRTIIGNDAESGIYMAAHRIFEESTYFGFFRDPEDRNIFYLCLYTGTKIPYNVISEWVRITDLRIATPHTADTPWIIFRSTRKITKNEQKFIKEIFTFIAQAYKGKNITLYGFKNRDENLAIENNGQWYWVYGQNIGVIDNVDDNAETQIATLVPIPGAKDTVLLVDRASNTHLFTLNTKKGDLTKLETPRTVI